jgi:uncharacterized membrane protein YeaQ/YmgE (transglycosylase-associated protein family)
MKEYLVHLLLLFAIGGAVGLASSALRIGRAPVRPHLDAALGVMGALFGGLVLARVVAQENVPSGDYGAAALVIAAVSACAPLAGLNLVRRKA